MLVNCKVPLDNDLGISAVIELGQLYKTILRGEWLYGDLEVFVSKNYIPFMEWWVDSERVDFLIDTDLAVEDWWKLIGCKLEHNKETIEHRGYKKLGSYNYSMETLIPLKNN